MTKRTLKAAQKHHLALELTTVEENDYQVQERIEIYPIDKYGIAWEEFIAAYIVNRNGSLNYQGSCFPGDHDMPAHLANEQALVVLLPEFAKFAASLVGACCSN